MHFKHELDDVRVLSKDDNSLMKVQQVFNKTGQGKEIIGLFSNMQSLQK